VHVAVLSVTVRTGPVMFPASFRSWETPCQPISVVERFGPDLRAAFDSPPNCGFRRPVGGDQNSFDAPGRSQRVLENRSIKPAFDEHADVDVELIRIF